jgi:hypothetical protein
MFSRTFLSRARPTSLHISLKPPAPTTTPHTMKFPIQFPPPHHHHHHYHTNLPTNISPKRAIPIVLTATASQFSIFDPLKDLEGVLGPHTFKPDHHLEKVSLAQEKTLDEWLEGDTVLKLNHIRRRAILEEEALNEARNQMTYQERKEHEAHLHMIGNKEKWIRDDQTGELYAAFGESDAVGSTLTPEKDSIFSLTNSMGILTPDEQLVLEKWIRDRDANKIIINYLCDDIANYLKSFCTDEISDVFDTIIQYFPRLIPHYLLGPYILNFFWYVLPTPPESLVSVLPSGITSPLYKASSFIKSGNVLVDLRCAINLSIIGWDIGTYAIFEFFNHFPKFYKYCGYYLIYPFSWFLHHYGDKELETHIIRCSMKFEEKVRMRNYYKKYGKPHPKTLDKNVSNPNTNDSEGLNFNPIASIFDSLIGQTSPTEQLSKYSSQPTDFINPVQPNGPRVKPNAALGV